MLDPLTDLVTDTPLRQRTWLLVVADFLPGGRTVAMFAAGALELPAARFYAFVVPGAVLWASFYSLLGYAGRLGVREWRRGALALGVARRSARDRPRRRGGA